MRKILFRLLILIGIVNAATIFLSALTGPNAYVIASSLKKYFTLLLCIIPLSLTFTAFVWWLYDIIRKPEVRVNYLAIAFCGILADAVSAIGTILFAEGAW